MFDIHSINLNYLGPLDGPLSVIWRRQFFECGEFEIHISPTQKLFRLLAKDNVIRKNDTNTVECGIIESVQTYEDEEKGTMIKAVGRFGSSILARRIINSMNVFNTTIENIARTLVSNSLINTTAKRKIANFYLGNAIGDNTSIETQISYKNLMEAVKELCQVAGLGFRVRADFQYKRYYFELYQGKDRTQNQNVNKKILFNEGNGNLINPSYTIDSINYKNYVLVGGQGEGSERIFATVDKGYSGFDLREEFLDNKSESQGELTLDTYINTLKANGEEALKEKVMVENFEAQALPTATYKYKQNWDLGDIVTVEKEDYNKAFNARITEVEEVYENGAVTITPILGTPLPTK